MPCSDVMSLEAAELSKVEIQYGEKEEADT
jgi:hypothetical protein